MSRPFDVLLSGTVFFDIVFTGFPTAPAPGTEVWTSGMGSSPGGIANLAVAMARLGLDTGLVAGFSTDLYGDWMWRTLQEEGVNLGHSCRYADWHTPVTVSLALDEDRSMITHGHPTPECVGERIASPPQSRAVFVDMGDPVMREAGWWRRSASAGSLVFADAGWDPEQAWDQRLLTGLDGVHAFTPNAEEAMGYTRTSTPEAALTVLGDHVPLAVVTDGARGVMAIDQTTGEQARADALHVHAVDPTGAGDVFAASLALSTLNQWPLLQRLRFGVLCSALAVQQFSGSLSAPGWGDVADWWQLTQQQAAAGVAEAQRTRRDYEFLDDCLPGVTPRAVRRAEATIAAFSDAGTHHSPGPPRVVGTSG